MLILSLLMAAAVTGAQVEGELREIDWLEMIPPEELKAMEEMAEKMWEIDHSGGQMEQLFNSANTVAEMDGVRGKLAGFVVPISVGSDAEITEFFFVPYFGACIHMPPPPPNQIVHVRPKTPITTGDIWDAFWIVGTLRVTLTDNSMAKSAYSFDLESIEKMEQRW
jgi:hypothetical protein